MRCADCPECAHEDYDDYGTCLKEMERLYDAHFDEYARGSKPSGWLRRTMLFTAVYAGNASVYLPEDEDVYCEGEADHAQA